MDDRLARDHDRVVLAVAPWFGRQVEAFISEDPERYARAVRDAGTEPMGAYDPARVNVQLATIVAIHAASDRAADGRHEFLLGTRPMIEDIVAATYDTIEGPDEPTIRARFLARFPRSDALALELCDAADYLLGPRSRAARIVGRIAWALAGPFHAYVSGTEATNEREREADAAILEARVVPWLEARIRDAIDDEGLERARHAFGLTGWNTERVAHHGPRMLVKGYLRDRAEQREGIVTPYNRVASFFERAVALTYDPAVPIENAELRDAYLDASGAERFIEDEIGAIVEHELSTNPRSDAYANLARFVAYAVDRSIRADE